MAMLHDPVTLQSIRQRLLALRPDTPRRWGSMTVDQMLWHVNVPLRESLGEYVAPPSKPPLPRALLRWLVLNVPWPRGARTRPDMVALEHHDFETERARCLALIDRFVAADADASWPASRNFSMTGAQWSQLHVKHLDHHLKQFGI